METPRHHHYRPKACEEYGKITLENPKFVYYQKNLYADIDTKKAALKVSSSVVSLVSYYGEKVLSKSVGTVIQVSGKKKFVITSAKLVRCSTCEPFLENKSADDLKIKVHASDESVYKGKIRACDFHYNLLVIQFKSKSLIQAASLSYIDLHQNIIEEPSFQHHPHPMKVKPGDPVTIVGRYFYEPFDLMSAPGLSQCGDGGPIINKYGQVMGIAYYYSGVNTIFLPINVAYKWWDHYQKYGELRHPSYGFEASEFHLGDLSIVEMVMTKFPSISSGVLIKKVLECSNAESAGLRQNDIIIKCEGKTVRSFLELWSFMWEKVGQSVELEVVRVDDDDHPYQTLSMVVSEATEKQMNQWPRYVSYVAFEDC